VTAGLFRASPHSRRFLWISDGRVRLVAVASNRVLRDRERLIRDLRRALG
jgi:hypothetical protein